eukprot:2355890-Rhodomonas_salina.3
MSVSTAAKRRSVASKWSERGRTWPCMLCASSRFTAMSALLAIPSWALRTPHQHTMCDAHPTDSGPHMGHRRAAGGTRQRAL